MAFKTVTDLSTDVTISLGGTNRKTNKKNPTSVEGYYLGKREVADAKKKSGVSYIYTFQTPKGNIGVWGKTDLDRKMQGVAPGTMVRASYDKMKPTANGDMYIFKVEIDEDNTVEVQGATFSESSSDEDEPTALTYSAADEEEDNAIDEELLQQQALASAERKAKVAALLNGKGKSKT